MDILVNGRLAAMLLALLSAGLPGCLSTPSVSIPPLTSGTVAEYDLQGAFAGYGLGLGQHLKDGRNSPLFPSSGTLRATVAEAPAVITAEGLMVPGFEFRYTYTSDRDYVLGKQLVVNEMGVVGNVRDAEQQTNGQTTSVWIHAWENYGPDLLLALPVAGRRIHSGEVEIARPSLDRFAAFEASVDGNRLVLSNRDSQSGPTWFHATWTSDCPFPATFQQIQRDGVPLLTLELASCSSGSGQRISFGNVPNLPPALAKNLDAQGLWISPSLTTTGPTVGAAWEFLTASSNYSNFCQQGCDLYSARKSETSRAPVVPLLAEPVPVHQWGFVLGRGSDEQLFVVEYAGASSPQIREGEATRARERTAMVGLSGDSLLDTIQHVVDKFGTSILTIKAQPAGATQGLLIDLTAGQQDQTRPQQLQVQATFGWQLSSGGRLGAFPWPSIDF